MINSIELRINILSLIRHVPFAVGLSLTSPCASKRWSSAAQGRLLLGYTFSNSQKLEGKAFFKQLEMTLAIGKILTLKKPFAVCICYLINQPNFFGFVEYWCHYLQTSTDSLSSVCNIGRGGYLLKVLIRVELSRLV